MDTTIIFQIHLLCTQALIGLIWFVQVVHYPMFNNIGPQKFTEYQLRHMHLTTYVVAPFMVGELITLLWLFSIPDFFQNQLFIASAVLFVLIWLSTALMQVPCHNKLLHGFNSSIHKKLVRSNWIRTIAWSLRGLLLILISLQST